MNKNAKKQMSGQKVISQYLNTTPNKYQSITHLSNDDLYEGDTNIIGNTILRMNEDTMKHKK